MRQNECKYNIINNLGDTENFLMDTGIDFI